MACRAQRKAPVRFTSRVRCQPSWSSSSTGPAWPAMPALSTSTSRPPSEARTSPKRRSTSRGEATSASVVAMSGRFATSCSSAAAATSQTCTFAPASANRAATTSPIPPAAAVTSTRLPSRPCDCHLASSCPGASRRLAAPLTPARCARRDRRLRRASRARGSLRLRRPPDGRRRSARERPPRAPRRPRRAAAGRAPPASSGAARSDRISSSATASSVGARASRRSASSSRVEAAQADERGRDRRARPSGCRRSARHPRPEAPCARPRRQAGARRAAMRLERGGESPAVDKAESDPALVGLVQPSERLEDDRGAQAAAARRASSRVRTVGRFDEGQPGRGQRAACSLVVGGRDGRPALGSEGRAGIGLWLRAASSRRRVAPSAASTSRARAPTAASISR